MISHSCRLQTGSLCTYTKEHSFTNTSRTDNRKQKKQTSTFSGVPSSTDWCVPVRGEHAPYKEAHPFTALRPERAI